MDGYLKVAIGGAALVGFGYLLNMFGLPDTIPIIPLGISFKSLGIGTIIGAIATRIMEK
jgi:hypothetical protein